MPLMAEDPRVHIWKSDHVNQYRWVLTFGQFGETVYHGNAKTIDQAMSDIEHCHKIYKLDTES